MIKLSHFLECGLRLIISYGFRSYKAFVMARDTCPEGQVSARQGGIAIIGFPLIPVLPRGNQGKMGF